MTTDDLAQLLRHTQGEWGQGMAHLLASLLDDAHLNGLALTEGLGQPRRRVLIDAVVTACLLADVVDLEARMDLHPSVAAVVRHAAERAAMSAAHSARNAVIA